MLYFYPREMKRKLLFFVTLACMVQTVPSFAITIKKAPTVSQKKNDAGKTGSSLLPTVINMVANVQEISKKQKALTAECIPSSQELDYANKIFKEWVKTGASSAKQVTASLKVCDDSNTYESSVRYAAAAQDDTYICYDKYKEDTIWKDYPIAKSVTYCPNDPIGNTCSSKEKKTVSNIYEILDKVNFSEDDWIDTTEATMAHNLEEKFKKCAPSKLNAQKRALWSEFIISSIGGIGSSTNTGSIMQIVQSTANSGTTNALQQITGNLTQFLQ